MKSILLDTHAWAWSLIGDFRLSEAALAAIDRAEIVLVSPISFFEIAQKVKLGEWPEMEPFVNHLGELLTEQGGSVAPLEPAICLNAAMMDWDHRDSSDRLIAATALYYGLPLVSIDVLFDGKVPRIW